MATQFESKVSSVCEEFSDLSDEAWYRLLAENLPEAVCYLKDGIVQWISPSAEHVLGCAATELMHQPLLDLVSCEDRSCFRNFMSAASRGGTAVCRLRVRLSDDGYRWVELHARPFRDADGDVDGLLGTIRIVDSEVAAAADLTRRAQVDSLTGAATRGHTLTRLDLVRNDVKLGKRSVGLLFCDVDRLKKINDNFGHAAGDVVLSTIGRRFARAIRESDWIGRLGGDELVIALHDVAGLEEVVAVGEALRKSMAAPIPIPLGVCIEVTVSIGATLVGAGETIDVVLARADAAMYEAKHQGRNRVVALAARKAS